MGVRDRRFFFDFSMTYVGAGMLVSHLVNFSLLVGAVLSWGIMWPLIRNLKGEWYPAKLSEGSMKSLTGYKAGFHPSSDNSYQNSFKSVNLQVFIPIALILGDGLYSFVKVLARTSWSMYRTRQGKSSKIGKNRRAELKISSDDTRAY